MINLYLLGQKGFIAVSELEEKYHKAINQVIIGIDKNVQQDFSSQIKEWCVSKEIKYNYNSEKVISPAKFSIAIGWRWLIKDQSELLVFHDSLLPKYRGFNPLVTALINGDEDVGVTVLKGVQGYDEGPIALQKKIKIQYPIKINEAILKISRIYANLLNDTFNSIISHKLSFYEQNLDLVSYSLWRDGDDYRIDWKDDSYKIKRFIDAVGFPYQGAQCLLNGNLLRIYDSEVVNDIDVSNRQPGKVIFKNKSGLTIVCGSGLLRIKDFYDKSGSLVRLNSFRLRFQ